MCIYIIGDIHGMFWLNDVPLFDASNAFSIPSVIEFVDRFVTTEQDPINDELKPFLAFQMHQHRPSCQLRVRNNQICRFGISYPPFPRTELLFFLPDDNSHSNSVHKGNFKKINYFLNAPLEV